MALMLPQDTTEDEKVEYDLDDLLSRLLLAQTAMMNTLELLVHKLEHFEARAEPLLKRAENRGRLFGG